ncbi:MAG: hypothetical protein RLZZ303_330 [Candidatus Hydrogenedentota bacterium]
MRSTSFPYFSTRLGPTPWMRPSAASESARSTTMRVNCSFVNTKYGGRPSSLARPLRHSRSALNTGQSASDSSFRQFSLPFSRVSSLRSAASDSASRS